MCVVVLSEATVDTFLDGAIGLGLVKKDIGNDGGIRVRWRMILGGIFLGEVREPASGVKIDGFLEIGQFFKCNKPPFQHLACWLCVVRLGVAPGPLP